MSWKYSLSEYADQRLPVLLKRRSFDEVTDLVALQMRVLCCHRSQVDGTEFRRPVYTVQIDRWIFDVFFNTPYGYRGSYFLAPGVGLEANLSFMRCVTPKLVADPLSNGSGLEPAFLRESLTTPSAKAWLAEHGKEIERKCPGCKGEWSSGTTHSGQFAEIENGRWNAASGQKSEWGRKAPYLTKLRIMGAFINDRYCEFIPHDKRFRAYDINEYGWS